MKNKFGQPQSAHTLLANAYGRVLANMVRKQGLSTGALLAAVMVAAGAAPGAGATTYTWDASGGAPLNDGAGSWNPTGGTNWFNGSTSAFGAWGNSTADEAVFGVNNGAAGTITVGSVNANKLTFHAPGSGSYTLSGGTITLGGTTPTITVDPGVSATIGSGLAGSAGLVKKGSGTLTLSTATKAYHGATAIDEGTLRLQNGVIGSGSDPTDVVTGSGTLAITNTQAVGILLVWGTANATVGAGFTGLIDVQTAGAASMTNNREFFISDNSRFAANNGDMRVNAGCAMYVNASTIQVDALLGSGAIKCSNNSLANTALTVGAKDGSGTFSGVFLNNNGPGVGVVNRVIHVTKTGAGTQIFSGTSTGHNGSITVANGILNITGSFTKAVTSGGATFSPSTGVTVSSGAALSGQGGSIDQTLTLNAGSTIIGVASVVGPGNAFRTSAAVTAGANVTILGSDGSATVGAHTIDVVGYGIGGTPGISTWNTSAYRAPAVVAPIVDDIVNRKITFSYTSEARTWDGGTWNNMVASSWQAGGTDQMFSAGDAVTFDDTAASGAVTLGTIVTPGAITFNNSTTSYTVSGSGSNACAIAGATGLTKNGTGTVTLATDNSYIGATAVNAGTLVLTGQHLSANTATAYTVGTGSGSAVNATLCGSSFSASNGNSNVNQTIDLSGGTAANIVDVKSDGALTAGSDAAVGTVGTFNITATQVKLAGTYLCDLNFNALTGMQADGSAGDLIKVTGNVDFTGARIVLRGINNIPALGSHYAIKLFEWSGTASGGDVGAGATPDFDPSRVTGLLAGQSIVRWGNAYYLVPEPASFALLGLGSLLLLRRPTRRRGRQSVQA